MAVTAVTVTYNSADTLDTLLASVHGQVDRMIVVDNASTDDTAEVVARRPDIEFVAGTANLGFATAVNVGLSMAGDDDIILLNPDVRCPPGSVKSLGERPRALHGRSLVAPLLRFESGEVQESARSFPNVVRLLARRTWFGRTSAGQAAETRYLARPEEPGPVDWAIGAALYVPFAVRDEIGPMDSRFFLYCEDLEWCVRAQRAGFGVFYDSDVEMTHAYVRASKETWRLGNRATRAHWVSMLRFTAAHPRLMLTGRL